MAIDIRLILEKIQKTDESKLAPEDREIDADCPDFILSPIQRAVISEETDTIPVADEDFMSAMTQGDDDSIVQVDNDAMAQVDTTSILDGRTVIVIDHLVVNPIDGKRKRTTSADSTEPLRKYYHRNDVIQ